MSRKKFIINEAYLVDLYINQKKSSYEIANIVGCGQKVVIRNMRECGIKGRPPTENKMPVKKGDKITWDLKNQTPEVNKKRSEALKGKFFPRKNGNYHHSIAVECTLCNKVIKKKYSNWKISKTKSFYCNDCNPTKLKKGQKPHNNKPKVKCNCDYCDKQIERVESQYDSYNKHFCNQECSGKWKSENITGDKVYNWKGGHDSYYGENWLRQRRACVKRDNNTCQVCNLTSNPDRSNMDVDHKIPFRLFSDYKNANNLNNLWCLCKSCHSVKTNWQTIITSTEIDDWEFLIKDLLKRKYIWRNYGKTHTNTA